MTFLRGRGRSSLLLPAALVTMFLAVSCVPTAESETESVGDPYEGAVTTQLRGVVAGLVGSGVLLQNHSPDELLNVEIVLNPQASDGGFRFRVNRIAANTTNPYVSRVFRTRDGTSFDDSHAEVTGFAVYADTPRGRGSWSGNYGPQGDLRGRRPAPSPGVNPRPTPSSAPDLLSPL